MCPISLDPFYVVSYSIKWVNTYNKYSTKKDREEKKLHRPPSKHKIDSIFNRNMLQ